MNVNKILKSLAVFFEKKQNSVFSYDVEKQKKYIKKLGNPKNNFERSYFQYKCQMKLKGSIFAFVLNIISLPLILFYLIIYFRNNEMILKERRDLVFLRNGLPENVLPKSLISIYHNIENEPKDGFIITKQDIQFIRKIILKYPLSWHFILKCLIKVGTYSFIIKKYSPDVIAVCAEYSFTSSLLTTYCNEKNIKHINVMHGEKLYFMRDSFFKFNSCYVWDEHYKKLFISMCADKNQFVIEIPPSLKFSESYIKNEKYDYTYYLGAESEEVLNIIANHLLILHKRKKRISIRPHPRYSNVDIVKKIFTFVNVEDTKKISIEQSLLQTDTAISLYSTVLNQALYNSIPIVIDDISNPQSFKKLNDLDYICLYKKHKLFSEVLKDIEL